MDLPPPRTGASLGVAQDSSLQSGHSVGSDGPDVKESSVSTPDCGIRAVALVQADAVPGLPRTVHDRSYIGGLDPDALSHRARAALHVLYPSCQFQ